MRCNFPAILVFFLCCTVFPIGAVADGEKTPLRIAYVDFPPFHWRDDGRMQGIFHAILVEALEKRMGQPIIWNAYPWVRCQENVKAGLEDALLTVPTEQRDLYTATHRQPFFEKPLHIFTFAGHPRLAEIMKITTLADIKKLNLSVITYSGNGWHNDKVHALGIKTHESAYLENVWPMLRQHRGDLIIEWPAGAQPYLKRLGLESHIVDTGIVLAKAPFFLLIRKSSQHISLLDRFDAVIQNMQDDGTMAAILKQHE